MTKINWNRIGQLMLWLVSLGGLVALMGFIEAKKNEAVCKDVKIYMPGNQYFVERDEIDRILQTGSITLKGRRMANINIQQLEKKLQANPFVEYAKVFMDMDGVINKFGQDFYIDEQGVKLPLSGNFTARVLVANGDIDELFANRVDTLHSKITRDVYRTARFIRADSLWDAQIEELYVNADREIEMIPRVGEQRILLGNADSLENKFDNLLAFYKKAIPMVGWDAYKTINIKYANQVVGVKNPEAWKDSAKTKRRVPAPMMTAARFDAPSTAVQPETNEPFIGRAEVPADNGPELVMRSGSANDTKPAAPVRKADKSLAEAIKKAVREESAKEAPKASAKKEPENSTGKTGVKKAPATSGTEKKEVKTAPAKQAASATKKTDNDVIIKPIILDPETKKSAEKTKSTSPNKKN